jgi:glycosyltransferase involved in cell wall biosynthesis
MSEPLVVIDADVLGRQRTGDETYVRSLLRELAAAAPADLRLAAITRRPELVPEGIEPVELRARSQVARMAFSVPRLLRRLRPALGHFIHALPLACPCPALVTIQDLSFERDPSVMGTRDRLIFRAAVPRAARRAARVLAISELTRRDLVELYAIPDEKIAVTPLAADPAFGPDGPSPDGEPYALFVGALQPRKEATTAIEALSLIGSGAPRLVLVGPDKGGRGEALGSEWRSNCAAISRRTSSPRSTAAPRVSSSPAATRASACRCSRRWPRARRWWRRPAARYRRWPGTQPCSWSPATR